VAGRPLPTLFEPQNLLVRGVNWLGDAVMTMPAIQRLRERFPRARISMLTNEKLAELWRRHPGVDQVLTIGPADNVWSIAERLRNGDFDLALVLPNSTRSALEMLLGRIPRRLGYSGNWRSWLLTQPVSHAPDRVRLRPRSIGEIKRLVRTPDAGGSSTHFAPGQHQVHDYLHLASMLGANPAPVPPKLELAPDDISSAAALLSRVQSGQTTIQKAPGSILWLGLNPSTAYGPAKRWPAERFAQVATSVCQRIPNSFWVVFGTDTDKPICDEVVRLGMGRIISLAGQTTLRQLMGLLKHCKLLLTNDSGPMHLASALEVPVVVPFGSTSPELTGPGQPGDSRHFLLRNPVACSPCFRRVCPIDFRCMTGISVDHVLDAVLHLMKA
jgi:heptosyltransferase-2